MFSGVWFLYIILYKIEIENAIKMKSNFGFGFFPVILEDCSLCVDNFDLK